MTNSTLENPFPLLCHIHVLIILLFTQNRKTLNVPCQYYLCIYDKYSAIDFRFVIFILVLLLCLIVVSQIQRLIVKLKGSWQL